MDSTVRWPWTQIGSRKAVFGSKSTGHEHQDRKQKICKTCHRIQYVLCTADARNRTGYLKRREQRKKNNRKHMGFLHTAIPIYHITSLLLLRITFQLFLSIAVGLQRQSGTISCPSVQCKHLPAALLLLTKVFKTASTNLTQSAAHDLSEISLYMLLVGLQKYQ
jgi:hypothetical protein